MADLIGALIVELSANIANFSSDLKRAEKLAKKTSDELQKTFEQGAKKIGLALASFVTIDAFARAIKSATDYGDKINELSARAGVGTESLSRLGYAAEQSGSDLDGAAAALVRIGKKAVEAANGNENLARIFKALGVEIKDAAGNIKASDDILNQFAEAFSKLPAGAEKAALAIEVFGKSGTALTQFLNNGAKGLREFGQEADNFGIVIDPATAQSFDDFNDTLAKLKSAASGVGIQFAAELAPALKEAVEQLIAFFVLARENGTMERFSASIATVVKAGVGLVEISVLIVSGLTAIYEIAEKAYAKLRSMAAAAGLIRGEGVGIGVGSIGNSKDDLVVQKGQKPNAETLALIQRLRAAFDANGKAAGAASVKVNDYVKAVRVLSLDKNAAKNSEDLAQAFARIKAELLPLTAENARYRKEIETINQAEKEFKTTASEANLLRKRAGEQHEKNTDALKKQKSVYDQIIESLDREAQAIRAQIPGRKDLERAARVEIEYRNTLLQLGAEANKLSDGELERLREKIELNDKLSNPETFNLGDAISQGIDEGLRRGSAGAGIKAFFDAFRRGFSREAGEGAGAFAQRVAAGIAGAAGGLAEILQARGASDGNAAGSTLRAVNNLAAQSGNVFAQAAAAIDTLFNNQLFGTDFARQSSRNSISLGASGFYGSQQTTDTRQRSFFRGTQTRVTTSALDQAAIDAGNAFQRAIDTIGATIGRAFGTDLASRVSASFVQSFDKDGKLTSTIATVAGRRVAAATQQAFEQYVTAETIIAALRSSIPNLDVLADPFRAAGESLLDFSRLALAAQGDIKAGIALLGEGSGIEEVTKLIQGLAKPGEALADAYGRVAQSTQALSSFLTSLGLIADGTREEFVKFSADLVEAFGSLDGLSSGIQRNIEAFFSPEQQRQFRANAARFSLNQSSGAAGITGQLETSEFAALFQRALTGEFSAERTAAIIRYGNALATLNDIAGEGQAELDQAARDAASARKEASQSLAQLIESISGSNAQNGLSAYQLRIQEIGRTFDENARNLTRLAREAGLASPPMEGVIGNLRQMAIASRKAGQELERSLLESLQSVFGDNSRVLEDYVGFVNGAARSTQSWSDRIKELDKLQAAQNIAELIRDYAAAFGKGFQGTVDSFGIPLNDLLRNLGVNLGNITSPESLAAFGRAAGLLNVTADELSRVSGIDLSALTAAQRAQLEAAVKPQENYPKRQADTLDLLAKSSGDSLIVQQDQAAQLALLRSSFDVMTSELRRIANRVPAI